MIGVLRSLGIEAAVHGGPRNTKTDLIDVRHIAVAIRFPGEVTGVTWGFPIRMVRRIANEFDVSPQRHILEAAASELAELLTLRSLAELGAAELGAAPSVVASVARSGIAASLSTQFGHIDVVVHGLADRTNLRPGAIVSSPQGSILVCDDEGDIRSTLKRTLHKYDVTEADSPSRALALMKSRAFAAIISDFSLGAEIDGLDLLTHVRLQYPDTLRLLVTANRDLDVAARAVNEGAVHRYFAKPWNDDRLRAAIEIMLRSVNSRF